MHKHFYIKYLTKKLPAPTERVTQVPVCFIPNQIVAYKGYSKYITVAQVQFN